MARTQHIENAGEFVNMTARARRVLSAVKDGHVTLDNDDHNALHALRLVLRDIARHTGAVPEIDA